MQIILEALIFFAPAGVANMAPVWAARLRNLDFLGVPLDGGKTFRGKRIFGDHKTVRGFLAGYVAALFTLLLFWALQENSMWFDSYAIIDYTAQNIFGWAFVLGIGPLVGDAVKSFFKRQTGHAPGSAWFPFDQTDYIIGGVVFSLPFVSLNWAQIIAIFLVWSLIHPIATTIGYLIKVKDSPI